MMVYGRNGYFFIEGATKSQKSLLEEVRRICHMEFGVPENQVNITPRGFGHNKVYDLSVPTHLSADASGMRSRIEEAIGQTFE